MADAVLYAHTLDNEPEACWQTLRAHAQGTADFAERFASAFGAGDYGALAGLVHDVGKANPAFQKRLRGSSEHVDHATAGAVYLCGRYPKPAVLLASVVAGHHGGLPNTNGESDGRTPLRARLRHFNGAEIDTWFPDLIEQTIDLPLPDSLSTFESITCYDRHLGPDRTLDEGYLFDLYTLSRLLYSSLVDADWLDTERFTNPDVYAEREAPKANMRELLAMLNAHMEAFARSSSAEGMSLVNAARNIVLADCREAAGLPTGIFTLEVPTGGGKTLSSMAFALSHAVRNGLDRVIYAIPYTSIVEQTASVFKQIFGAQNVLEHHSNYDYGLSSSGEGDVESAFRERLLTQNWDAPIVVTTNVQLLESLFASSSSKSRKVHNVAKSVVVLDEVQTLPDRLLTPTLAMFESMTRLGQTTFVLCSATQPALDKLWPSATKPVSIVHDRDALEEALGGRVEFDVSRVGDAAFSLEELVDALACESRVLCVVSSRKAARLVFEALRERFDDDEGLFHLSALMVPAHRSEVIEGIRNRLACGLPCRAVSTQLIEAGVDLDFPVLYRETAGIDSMLQAAGRCNRNGRLPRRGRAVMFDCLDFQGTKRRGTNWLATQRDLGLETIDWGLRKGVDPFGREGVQRYFNRRHETAQTLDEGDIYRGLTRGGLRDHFVALGDMQACVYSCEFRRIADAYRIVDDDGVGVFVPWGSEGAALLDRMKGGELGLGFGALVQRFSVSLPPWMVRECRDAGSLYEVGPWLVADIGFGSALTYDELGLGKPSEGPVFDYIVM